MRVAVFGTGGVGGYLGARLAETDSAEVHLIARGAHLDALRRDGLTLESVHGDAHVRPPATDDPADIGPVDAVVFTVKATDTATAAAELPALVGPDTAVITFQNGVKHEEAIGTHVGVDHVLGGAAFIFATITAPGVVTHTGGPTRFVFGELDGRRTARAARFHDACLAAGIDMELSDDIQSVLWRKFVFICAQSGLTAATRLPIGAIRDDPAAWSLFRRIVEEARAVAVAEGVALADDTVEQVVEFARGLDPDGYSSLYHDLTHGKPMELEALNGTALRLGRRHGIPVPANEAVYAVLSPWARRNRRER